MNRQKLFRCRYCKEKFPYNELQVKMPQVCKGCIMDYFKEYKSDIVVKAKKDAKKRSKQAERKRIDKMREELMTLSDWMKIAQRHFNAYIRERDKKCYDNVCLACLKPIRGVSHAGHYYSVGAFPELRFDEMNCHACCPSCNLYKSGNLIEYTLNLPKRIGQDEFDALRSRRNKPKNYTIPEIKDIIEKYKNKLKELNNNSI